MKTGDIIVKISEILKNNFTISFEFFPPKTSQGEIDLFSNLRSLENLEPSFVSVTYGAGGSSRDSTRRVVTRIAREEKLNVMAHLTSVAHSRSEVLGILEDYKNAGIDNIMALRGDSPAGSGIEPCKGEIPHASDLMAIIREKYRDYFSLGGAVYTCRHPESASWDDEMTHLEKKIEAGMDFGITQLFFNNRDYYEFMERCLKRGLSIPVIPGIMPVTGFSQIERFSTMCNAVLPAATASKMEKYKDTPSEVEKIGVDFAIAQCRDLLANNVRGIHFYTLNKSQATLKIYRALRD
jgi:methylenetetrahydrofolate reductase (NADPH)